MNREEVIKNKYCPLWLKEAEWDGDVSIRDSQTTRYYGSKEWASDIIWNDGVWHDGIWWGGTWKNGIWMKGTWLGGHWMDGRFINGVWKDGTWDSGTWEGGIIKGGNFRDIVFKDDLLSKGSILSRVGDIIDWGSIKGVLAL